MWWPSVGMPDRTRRPVLEPGNSCLPRQWAPCHRGATTITVNQAPNNKAMSNMERKAPLFQQRSKSFIHWDVDIGDRRRGQPPVAHPTGLGGRSRHLLSEIHVTNWRMQFRDQSSTGRSMSLVHHRPCQLRPASDSSQETWAIMPPRTCFPSGMWKPLRRIHRNLNH